MDIKLVAIDLDGTTLSSKDRLSSENKNAIENAIKKGVLVVPSTGRAYNGIPKEIMNIKGIKYAITSNGGCVIDIDKGNIIYQNLLPIHVCKNIITEINKYSLYMDVYINGKAFAEKRFLETLHTQDITEERKNIILKTRTPVENLLSFLDTQNSGVEKLNINLGDKNLYEFLWKKLDNDKNLCITTSLKNLIEINNSTTSKADGLKNLCEYLNISHENTMALGDGLNDTKMFEFVNYSVAMENASEKVKSCAKYITLTNDKNGLSAAFKRFIFQY